MEYFISKLSFCSEEKMIDNVFAYQYEEDNLVSLDTKDRNWLVNRYLHGYQISTLNKNSDGQWLGGGKVNHVNNLFNWDRQLPLNITRRKTFISYYHYEDQEYKEKFNNIFEDLVVHKSVKDGDIDSDNSDEYIKQLIQKDYLADTTILVVLIGSNTKHRKHIDWEISGALNLKVGDKCAGILGLKLPSHQDYGTGSHHYSLLPDRLSDNLKSNYAIIRDWTDDRVKMQEYIELAFEKRNTNYEDRDNSRLQMTDNTNE
ncbi:MULTISPECIES: TIR domain-containing protein [unclassified Flavobacterium]|uniref:TIR domain-containing protein n=1 Tax=unclassified Flavobacterium TaxID=196869 RepID=UPI00086D0623|nr:MULTISPECIES: TIR domain-containing protein [unclassified Flavobacterium]MBN9286093.1 TIR domain-containing protein [Flavobacterium sp.]ODS81306.1 MAG: hypothetical protein ABS44_19455 [Chryseobacterium sp. SCN 40-13]OJV67287.1 MAG: hypothetical protein BGO42_11565 [Flavobacterium sp. 40-81]